MSSSSSSTAKPKFVDNVGRRKFDLNAFRAAEEEQERQDEIKANKNKQIVQRNPLKARDYQLDLTSKVGKYSVITAATALENRGGFFCKSCECLLKDSSTYLDHINGRKHQRNLGMSMRTERSTLQQVKEKFASLKKQAHEVHTNLPSVQERLAKMEEDAKRYKEAKKQRRKELKQARKQAQAEADGTAPATADLGDTVVIKENDEQSRMEKQARVEREKKQQQQEEAASIGDHAKDSSSLKLEPDDAKPSNGVAVAKMDAEPAADSSGAKDTREKKRSNTRSRSRSNESRRRRRDRSSSSDRRRSSRSMRSSSLERRRSSRSRSPARRSARRDRVDDKRDRGRERGRDRSRSRSRGRGRSRSRSWGRDRDRSSRRRS